MIRYIKKILLVFVILLAFNRCAQVGALGGGPRDLTPPKLLEAFPENKNTNFNTSTIYLRFGEFVQLKDISNQLIISPKLKTAPEITAEGKKIKISLQRAELLPSTTYRFYFGSAIADMHEGNALRDFEYIFSTGPFIDSLKLKGRITEAYTNKPQGGMLVGLYDNAAREDSLPYVRTPDYIARTDQDGKFAFGNLPFKNLEVYAFADKNKNNLYDGDAETVAFLGPDMQLVKDTTIELKEFQEESAKTYIKKSTSPYYGFGQIILNKKSIVTLSTLKALDAPKVVETNKALVKDTISFFYKDISDTLALILDNKTSGTTDTLKMQIPRSPVIKRKIKNITTNSQGGRLGLNEKLQLNFPFWMDTTSVNSGRLRIKSKDDSLIGKQPVRGKWLGISCFELDTKLKEGVAYSLRLDTAAFSDITGALTDSVVFNFKTRAKSELGKATIQLTVSKKQSYIVQLVTEQQKVVAQQTLSFSLSSSNAVSIDFTDILPGTYLFKVIFDNNENKKWDTGNLLLKKYPEKVFINQKQLKILSDWEIEEEISIKD